MNIIRASQVARLEGGEAILECHSMEAALAALTTLQNETTYIWFTYCKPLDYKRHIFTDSLPVGIRLCNDGTLNYASIEFYSTEYPYADMLRYRVVL